jgi:hypothetical protein
MITIEINTAYLSANGNGLTCGIAHGAVSVYKRTRTTIGLVIDGPTCNQQEELMKRIRVACAEKTLTLLRLIEHRMHFHTREGVMVGRGRLAYMR